MENCIDLTTSVQHLIGTRYVESVKAYILEMTGLMSVIGPNDISTMDIRTDRIYVDVDEAGNISRLRIG
ncbi:I78 family peptidase inhibitor [Pseudomonas monteilii]|uniref:I78 family peptidase inhibitor n=1 Tax=Pseudomonas alabamensis TaxID=3064349 RepID=UPI00271319A8|nr:I78 family peptidase inhibitor [Pseudomonas sp. 22-AL-CL-001]MDO7909735.1 I78 family peptidase inhibitor [Pseudomonas sp. 22-AL-CL-001]